MAKLLEGKPIAQKIKEGLREEIRLLKVKPVLASLQAGENASAASYVNSQLKAAQDLGIEYRLEKLSANAGERELAGLLERLNADPSVNGIIIQMPLPPQIDYKRLSEAIHPDKDVEGMHPANIGRLFFGRALIRPCTPAAVMELLASCSVDLYGKEAVVVGHSEIVGKPLALMLLDKFATVSVAHIGTSKAGRLEEHVKRAEILIVAVGKAGLIKGDWVKEGAIVIDVGINRVEGKIVGDVEFEQAAKRASYITPVPGGVGPLTVTMLMRNLVEAAKSQQL